MTTCSPAPIRGQKIETSVTPMKTSMGLRYWASINPRFDIRLSKYQPSWKFSTIPQNAQTLEMTVDNATAVHPTTRRLLDLFTTPRPPWMPSEDAGLAASVSYQSLSWPLITCSLLAYLKNDPASANRWVHSSMSAPLRCLPQDSQKTFRVQRQG